MGCPSARITFVASRVSAAAGSGAAQANSHKNTSHGAVGTAEMVGKVSGVGEVGEVEVIVCMALFSWFNSHLFPCMAKGFVNASNALKVHGALLLAALLYGASYSIARHIMPRLIAPEPFILLRVWISCAVFWLVYALQPARNRVALPRLSPSDHRWLLLCAVFGVAGNMLLFFKGLAVSSPISAAVIMITTPLFILAFALLFSKEKGEIIKIGGMVVGAVGAGLLIYSADSGAGVGAGLEMRPNTVAGNLMVLLNALFFAVYLILVKPLLARLDTLQLMRWLFLYGSLLVTPFGWAELHSAAWNQFSPGDWMSFWFIILGISVGAYWLNAWSLKHTRATVVGSYIYLQPLLAAVFGLFWGESVQAPQLVFGSLVVAGVFMVGSARK